MLTLGDCVIESGDTAGVFARHALTTATHEVSEMECGVKMTFGKFRIGCLLIKGHDGPHKWLR